MTSRDMAAVSFKTLALWLFLSGFAGLFSGLLTSQPPDTAPPRDGA